MFPITTKRYTMQILLAAGLLSITMGCKADDLSANSMRECSRIGVDLERLNCYDRLTAKLPVEAPSLDHQESTPTISADELFGLTAGESKPERLHRAELKSITSHVVAFHESSATGATLTLANGQEWRQVGHEDLMLGNGQKVVISRGAFDSFWIVTENNRSAHVKRVR